MNRNEARLILVEQFKGIFESNSNFLDILEFYIKEGLGNIGGSGGNTTYVQDQQPTTGVEGDVWFNTQTGEITVYNVSTSTWEVRSTTSQSIYTDNGQLSSDRTVELDGKSLVIQDSTGGITSTILFYDKVTRELQLGTIDSSGNKSTIRFIDGKVLIPQTPFVIQGSNFNASFLPPNSITDNRDFEFPDRSGTLALQDIQQTTYTQLVLLISQNKLVPNQQYIITDYQTQGDLPGWTDTFQGSIEPLIVTAQTINKLFTRCKSTQHPQDEIEYDPMLTTFNRLTGTILRRVDTVRNIDTPFDFREQKFRTYQDVNGVFKNIIDIDNTSIFEDTTFISAIFPTSYGFTEDSIKNIKVNQINQTLLTFFGDVTPSEPYIPNIVLRGSTEATIFQNLEFSNSTLSLRINPRDLEVLILQDVKFVSSKQQVYFTSNTSLILSECINSTIDISLSSLRIDILLNSYLKCINSNGQINEIENSRNVIIESSLITSLEVRDSNLIKFTNSTISCHIIHSTNINIINSFISNIINIYTNFKECINIFISNSILISDCTFTNTSVNVQDIEFSNITCENSQIISKIFFQLSDSIISDSQVIVDHDPQFTNESWEIIYRSVLEIFYLPCNVTSLTLQNSKVYSSLTPGNSVSIFKATFIDCEVVSLQDGKLNSVILRRVRSLSESFPDFSTISEVNDTEITTCQNINTQPATNSYLLLPEKSEIKNNPITSTPHVWGIKSTTGIYQDLGSLY